MGAFSRKLFDSCVLGRSFGMAKTPVFDTSNESQDAPGQGFTRHVLAQAIAADGGRGV